MSWTIITTFEIPLTKWTKCRHRNTPKEGSGFDNPRSDDTSYQKLKVKYEKIKEKYDTKKKEWSSAIHSKPSTEIAEVPNASVSNVGDQQSSAPARQRPPAVDIDLSDSEVRVEADFDAEYRLEEPEKHKSTAHITSQSPPPSSAQISSHSQAMSGSPFDESPGRSSRRPLSFSCHNRVSCPRCRQFSHSRIPLLEAECSIWNHDSH
jgi:hypothetical protein